MQNTGATLSFGTGLFVNGGNRLVAGYFAAPIVLNRCLRSSSEVDDAKKIPLLLLYTSGVDFTCLSDVGGGGSRITKRHTCRYIWSLKVRKSSKRTVVLLYRSGGTMMVSKP